MRKKSLAMWAALALSCLSSVASAQFVPQYTATYDYNPGYDSVVTGMTVDQFGDTVLTGYYEQSGLSSDMFVMMYNSVGNLKWKKTFDGAAHLRDEGVSVGMDGGGYIYVAGKTSTGNGFDIFLQKYSFLGTLQWTRTYNHAVGASDVPIDMKVDNSGNCYIVGDTQTGSTPQSVVLKYDNAGTMKFATLSQGIGNHPTGGVAIDYDSNGNCYVAQYLSTNGAGQYYAELDKYSPTGFQDWYQTYGDPTHPTAPGGLTVTPSGRVAMITNTLISGGNRLDVFEYDFNGNKLWQTPVPGQNGGQSVGTAIKGTNLGKLMISGQYFKNTNRGSMSLEMNESDGTVQFLQVINGLYDGDTSFDVAVESRGNGYFAGDQSRNLNGSYAIVTDAFGSGMAGAYYGSNLNEDRFIKVALDGNKNIYASGYTSTNADHKIVLLIKYFEPATALNDGYSTGVNKTLTVDAAHGVLSNDAGEVGTAVLVQDGGHGKVTLSSDGSFIYNPDPGFNGGDKFTYKINAPSGISNTATAFVAVYPNMTSLTFNPPSVVGGGSSTATLTFDTNASNNNIVVSLASADPSAVVPPTADLAMGSHVLTFPITTTPVAVNKAIGISATLYGTTKSAIFVINVPKPVDMTLTPSTLIGGSSFGGMVTLNGAAPTGGLKIFLSSASAVIHLPASVTVAAGATTCNFTGTTDVLSATAIRPVTATGNGVAVTKYLTIQPGGLQKFTISPDTVFGGSNATGTVTLSGPAPSDTVINLASQSAVVHVPATVTVLAGQSTAMFTVNTSDVSSPVLRAVTASWATVQLNFGLTLMPVPKLVSLDVNPSTIKGGQTATGTVNLSAAASTGGVVVNLSDNSTAISVPPTVTVPAGKAFAQFTVSTSPVGVTAIRTVTASYNGVTKVFVVTLTP